MNESPEIVQRLCSQCNNVADTDAKFCKHCGFDFVTESKPRRNNTVLYVGGGIAVLAVMAFFGFVTLKSLNRNNQVSIVENSDANLTSSFPNVLSAKAQQVEEKILRGETLSESDTAGLSIEELRILRNVHFARYGRKYERPGLGDYFYTRPWYKPSDDYKDSMINATDKSNINLILAAENPQKSNQTAVAGVNSNPTIQPSPTSSKGELTRDTVLSLLNGRRKDVIIVFSRDQPSYAEARYERLMNAGVISCKKFYPMQGVTNVFKWNECAPGKNSNGLKIQNSVWLELEVGYKIPSRVDGISKINENTSYADVVFSFQQGKGFSLYSNYSNAFIGGWSSAPNISDEVRRVILRLYDDGWRVENIK